MLSTAEERLWAALRAGRRDDVVQAVLSLPEDRRRRLRPAVRRHERLVDGEPIGARRAERRVGGGAASVASRRGSAGRTGG